LSAVVESGAARRRPGNRVAILLLVVLTAGALGHVFVRMKKIEVGYALGRERKRNEELREQQRRLQIEIGMLKDPGRVVTLAREELGMGPPEPGDIRVVVGPPVEPEERAFPETPPAPGKAAR
jgi:cell division protein FtsL